MLWLEGPNTDLSIPLPSQGSLVNIGRATDEVVIIHDHQLGVDIDWVTEGVSCCCSPSRGRRILETIRNIFRRLSFTQAIKGKVIHWIGASTKSLDSVSDPGVHALNCAELPTQDLLTGCCGGITFRVHWDTHIAVEGLASLHLLDDLLCDLPRYNMRCHRVLVVKPGVGRPEEILVFDVDEGLCVSDEVDILPHDRVVDQPSPLLEHVDLIRSILGNVKILGTGSFLTSSMMAESMVIDRRS